MARRPRGGRPFAIGALNSIARSGSRWLLEAPETEENEPTRREWTGFWSTIALQTQNAFNDKAAQFLLIPLGGSIMGKASVVEQIAGLMITLPYVLFARGLRSIPGHEATSIGLTEPILMPVWALLAWGIPIDSWTLAGGGLILTGLAVRYLPWAARPASGAATNPTNRRN